MPVRRTIPENHGTYFITFTCYKWLPLIEIVNGYDIVYNWFDHLKSKGHFINAYVIMPNHVHAMISFSSTAQSINTIIGNGKRFIAYEIIDRLQKNNNQQLLQQLESSVPNTKKARNKLHEVWEASFDWKECIGYEFITQKLDYIHMNPCTKKWTLCNTSIEYMHSSAVFYTNGTQSVYPVTNFRDMQDVNLSIGKL